ncbi:MAG: tetratricopeptide repeat protein [Acidobacteriia bacterium]|nr:tetratricopeptide repeat protein [Terriglobia bacterium]
MVRVVGAGPCQPRDFSEPFENLAKGSYPVKLELEHAVPPEAEKPPHVAMPDIDKLYDKAAKYLQRHKFEAALETYQEILRYEPNDEEALVNLGDLSLKLNRTADGLRYQSELADFYIKRGDVTKAVATCRRILKHSPQEVATLAKLAGLLEKSQKTNEALETYREALGHYRKLGTSALAIECLSHIVKLDPNNLEEHRELGELASLSRETAVAAPAFLRAAQLARRAGDESRWEKFVEQAHEIDPSDEAAGIAAAELYLKRGQAAEAVALVGPVLEKKPEDLEVLELAGCAYLGVEDYATARPLCWKLYQAKPERVDLILKLMEGLIQKGEAQQVLGMANNLKERLFQQGKGNEFLRIMERVYESDESNLEVLQTLSNLYNEMNKEDGLRRSLTRLFNLYLASEKYQEAADTLDRILDVDPYGEGHHDRLLSLEGHIDPIWYKNILTRLQPPSTVRTSPTLGHAGTAEAAEKAESLEELIVEGEMYSQYQLSARLQETLEKIDRLFPGAEEKNERLRELYEAAEYTPKFKAPVAAASAASAPRTEAAASAAASFQSLEDLRKVSEITANIYRESTPQGVLQVAVNEIGRTLNASRCWGALGTPDRPPVLTAEHCSPLVSRSDSAAALKLCAFLVTQVVTSRDGWAVDDAVHAPLLSAVAGEIQKLGIRSLLALPLIDKDEVVGLLLLEQCDAPRAWSPGESLLLRAIATQVVIAINNTKLRRLVRSLAGTDPETGLLPRSSYLDCLLSEAQRSKDQAQPLSVCLLEPENPRALMKLLGDAGVQRFVQQVSKILIPALRQNDISIRYSPLSIVVVFPDTALSQAGLAVEKVKRALAQVPVNGGEVPIFCAAVCDVPPGPTFEAVDGVTEVINRLEASLDRARKKGGKRVLISKFTG